MKVYVVMTGGPEESWVDGIYADRAAAQARAVRTQQRRKIAERRRIWGGRIEEHAYGFWTKVEEWEVRGRPAVKRCPDPLCDDPNCDGPFTVPGIPGEFVHSRREADRGNE